MTQTFGATRDKRPASRAARPCPERIRPELTPPACCPSPREDARRRRGKRPEQLLAAEIALGERRAQALECGIDCLEDDIEKARVAAAPILGVEK